MYEKKAREILAINLKKYRNQLGLSQEKFAEKLDTEPYYISHIENARRNIQIDMIGKIADILEVKLKDLFLEENG